MAEPTLKPCPFCGEAPRYLAAKPGFYSERVICDSCSFHLYPGLWNRRTEAPQPEREVACPESESAVGVRVGDTSTYGVGENSNG